MDNQTVILQPYFTMKREAESQGFYEEKKSRFLSFIMLIESEEEARAKLQALSKQYWDANHHVYAYRLGLETVTERFSDDKEPGGTAGLPTLSVLKGEGLKNTMIVTVRYFGGTLLGTGGLVRAYTKSAQAAVAQAKTDGSFLEVRPRLYETVSCPYAVWDSLKYQLTKADIAIEQVVYSEMLRVTLSWEPPQEKTVTELLSSFCIALPPRV